LDTLSLRDAFPISPRLLPAGDAALEPGTYLVQESASSAVDYTVTVPEGWSVQEGEQLVIHSNQAGETGMTSFVVEKVYAKPCQGERGPEIPVGHAADDLVAALLAQPGPVKSAPVAVTLGGFPATRVDLRVPDRMRSKNCFRGPGTGMQIWLSDPDDYLVLDDQGLLSIYVVDLEGERAVFTTQYRPGITAEEDRAAVLQILESIHIEK
jgi:hypothetical protein